MFFIILTFCFSDAQTLLCGHGYDTDSCQAAVTSSGSTGFTPVLKTGLSGPISDITDLNIISKSLESFDLSALGLTSLVKLKVIGESSVTVTLKLPPTLTALTLLEIKTATVDITSSVSANEIIFSGTTKGSLKEVENAAAKKVTLKTTQEVDLIDAPLYYPIILDSGVTLKIKVPFDLSADQKITFKSNGFKILNTDLIIDSDHIPSESYIFVPTVTGSTKNLVFAADEIIEQEISLELEFKTITTAFKVTFDPTWGTSSIKKRPTINLIIPAKDKLSLHGAPTKNALLTLKSANVLLYMYPIIDPKIEFCLEASCEDAADPDAKRIDATKKELADYLNGIEDTVESITFLIASNIVDVELGNLSVKSELSIILVSDNSAKKTISFKSMPPVPYKWELKKIDVTLTSNTTMKTLTKGVESTITNSKLLVEQCIGNPTVCTEFNYVKYIYEGTTALSTDYEITFDEKTFSINTSPATKIELTPEKIKASNVEIRLTVMGKTGTSGIKFKLGTTGKAEYLTLSIISIDAAVSSLPIEFDDWTNLGNNIKVDILVQKTNYKKVSVSNVPDSKVTMVLKDSEAPYHIYDMKPLTATSYGICIDTDNTKCDEFYEKILDENILVKNFATIDLANTFMDKNPITVQNLSIGSSVNIESTKPLNLSKITTNISNLWITGLNINEQEPTPSLINIKAPKDSLFVKNLAINHVNTKIIADENKTMEIINIIFEKAATITGQYHIQSHEFPLDKIGDIKGGVVSDRVFIQTEFNGPSYLLFDENNWIYLVGTDLTKPGKSITPGNITFESKAIFLKLIHNDNGKFTMKPKTKAIQKANTITLLIEEPPKNEQPKSLLKKTTTEDVAPTTITVDFDEDWKAVNLTERFTLRVIGDTKSVTIDQTNTNSKFINIVEKTELPPQSKDATDLNPNPETGETAPKPKGLSTGAIVGIVVGCVAGVAAIAVGVFFYIKKSKARVSGASP